MIRSNKVFFDQLYFNLQALFVNDRLIKYADKISGNEKFKLMVQVQVRTDQERRPPIGVRRFDTVKELI